jgi:cyclic pyranopterin phosphate synthase
MLQDRFGRHLKTLRVSVTDRCDLRCVYCMPAEGAKFVPVESLLSEGELTRAIKLFAGLGMTRFKFTGGEPLLCNGLEELLKAAAIAGAEELSLTTNATRLAGRAASLRKAGLQRVTVSLDSLDPARFSAITRGGDLAEVWRGILAAEQVGLAPIKLNTVLMDQSEKDLLDLARLSLEHAWSIRFIEYMPMTSSLGQSQRQAWDGPRLRQTLEAHFGALESVESVDPAAPAKLYRIAGAPGKLGFIDAISQPFCSACDRLRLSADGFLRLCMAHADGLDLRSLLRSGASDKELEEGIRQAAWMKPEGHAFYREAKAAEKQMSHVGG